MGAGECVLHGLPFQEQGESDDRKYPVRVFVNPNLRRISAREGQTCPFVWQPKDKTLRFLAENYQARRSDPKKKFAKKNFAVYKGFLPVLESWSRKKPSLRFQQDINALHQR
jgi:hypothetical protein